MRIDELQSALAAVGVMPTPRELAEILWLAHFLGRSDPKSKRGQAEASSGPQRASPEDTEGPPDMNQPSDAPPVEHVPKVPPSSRRSVDNRKNRSAFELHLRAGSTEDDFGAASLLVPAAPALGKRLALQRALRPLKRTVPSQHNFMIDENATADSIAEYPIGQRVWVPVIRPARDRWLDLTLVIDVGYSMTVWAQLADELRNTLVESAIFRNVTTWYMASDFPDRVTLDPGRLSRKKQDRPPEALLRPDGRHVIVVLSDCSGSAWHSGAAGHVLRNWGRHGPVAIFQPLPERLWSRTAAPTTVGRALAATAAAPNSELDFAPLDGLPGLAAGAIAVPVLEIAPDWVRRWAAMIATGGTLDSVAVAYLTGEPQEHFADVLPAPTPRQRVLDFRAAASPQAFRLAQCLATTTPALQVMQLVQHAVLEQSVPTHVAEVILSGLLHAANGPPGHYEFVEGVREVLLNTVGRSDAAATVNVIAKISARIERDAGLAARTFAALVGDDKYGSSRIDSESRPFALINPEALNRLLPGRRTDTFTDTVVVPDVGDQELIVPELEPTLAAVTDDKRLRVPDETAARTGGVDIAMQDDAGRVDLFVSHAGRDRPWAEWVAWELQQAGYRVELEFWDWQVGDTFVEKMRDALERADRIVALFSEAYFVAQRYPTGQREALLTDRDAARPRLLPFRIENVTPPTILRPLLSRDLFGVSEAEARRRLLEAVGGRRRPDHSPGFPEDRAPLAGGEGRGPRLPGWLPPVWNIPLRNTAFTGRDGMIVALRDRLSAARQRQVVEVLRGMGGVGKTQLAIEYGHRFAGDYDLCWWIDCAQPELIGEQLTGLAVALQLVKGDAGTPKALAAVKSYLGQYDRWLLIFDNVDAPAAVREWLPSGPGHVLITSRHHVWGGVAEPLSVDVFARTESLALLGRHVPTLTDTDADRLAEALGDLPLAVAQAAGLLADTGMSASEYLEVLAEHAAQITAEGTPFDYPVSLAAAVRLSHTRLDEEDPAAGQLLRLCAFLAPEPIPLDLFSTAPDGLLPEPLAATVRTPLALHRSVGRIAGYWFGQPRRRRPDTAPADTGHPARPAGTVRAGLDTDAGRAVAGCGSPGRRDHAGAVATMGAAPPARAGRRPG